MSKPFLGAHMPTAGGVHNALTSGRTIGCEVVQIFTASPRQWKANPISDETIAKFRVALDATGCRQTIAHDSYLINLAAPPDSEIIGKSRAAFRAELERAEALGLDFLVSHPGAHGGDGEETGIARLIESLDIIHAETEGFQVRTALETTAGQGTYLGGKFEHLAQIIHGVKNPERLCVCLDTCHIFAAGYDIRDTQAYEETMGLFDQIIGIDQLKVIHANDSLKKFGSHADRHAHIGDGEIGLTAFHLLVNDPRMHEKAIVVETPDAETMHEVNVKRLRDLIGADAPLPAAPVLAL
ncbi:putative endonuclease 4 [Capsulimonas corticalis]|uniref:Probable endonuclease 4 n=1 Tax=Capsulimonas corticalis TaxID=2219043 RepID=A0A402CQD2_9BACT|nr:deoxyribonuclease IV [Capsulimonas corticalis]BDI32738.1 putative endonuclease 4 [Capsulimonas corticalis]